MLIGRSSNDVDWDSIVAYRSQQGLRNRSRTRFLAAATANIGNRNVTKSSHRPHYRYFGGVSQNQMSNSMEPRHLIGGNSSVISAEESTTNSDSKIPHPRLTFGITPVNDWEQGQILVNPGLSSVQEEWLSKWHPSCEWNEQSPAPISPNFGRETRSPDYRERSISPMESPIPARYSNSSKINFPTVLPSPTDEMEEVSGRCYEPEICHSSNADLRLKGGEFKRIVERVPPHWPPDIGQKRRPSQRPRDLFARKSDFGH